MPAIELNTLPAEAHFNWERQVALAKLWLIVTGSQYVSLKSTKFFDTTAEAEAWQASQADVTTKTYYLDLQKLQQQLGNIFDMDQIKTVFEQVQDPHLRTNFANAASHFWQFGVTLDGYGHVGCFSVPDALNISNNNPGE